ncbi:MAG TPA: OB-fold nucleic acid binding domain-containing protein, partial [Rhodanobacter sp.]|nr:OB-fold nucleic acid binding domain-containing protein [Rhodanobacter sp.]
GHALRMGLRMVRGFGADDARRIEQARTVCPFADVADLCERAALDARSRERLADAGTLRGLAGHRHRVRWAVAGVEAARPLLDAATQPRESRVVLPLPSLGEDLQADYATLGTTLQRHPLALLRAQLRARHCRSSKELAGIPSGRNLAAAGLVVGRQRPGTAGGVTFVTLEDEHGMINVVVWRQLAERQRHALLASRLLMVEGRLEVESDVRHLIARRLHDLTPLLSNLAVRSRDFK